MSLAHKVLTLWAIGIFLLIGSTALADIAADPLKTATATRIKNHPHIDGALNESAWESAESIEGFRQTEPDEGKPGSEKTIVRVLYDDEALYIGFYCYDDDPEKISKVLTRRDRWTEADQVAVRIDTHHDHQSGFYFCVNAAGVVRDILLYDNVNSDESWDAVWTAAAKIMPWGWSAEMKIPFSAIRFSNHEEYTWGIDFSRYIPRRNEIDRWQFVPSHETSGVSRFGHLVGIEGIEPPSRIETLPYLVSYGVTEPKSLGNIDGRKYISNVGVDFKYGISSSITLDAAINPDFGQVESDRSVINLSTYETFYEEKRPFFLEGTDIFNTPYFHQFYSRRIGRSPQGSVDGAEYYIDYPSNTTLLSAVKLTGKTSNGTSFGILNTVTQEEKTKYRMPDDDAVYEAVVEPMAAYSVIRLKQDIAGSSYLGGMMTSINQDGKTDAYTASTDWRAYFLNERYCFEGQLLGTNNGPGTSDYAAYGNLQRMSGKIVRGSFAAYHIGQDADWNRLGYMEHNARQGYKSWIQFYSNKSFSIIKYLRLNFNNWYNSNLDGYRLTTGGNVNGSITFSNNYWVNIGVGRDESRFDDRETRGNGVWYIRGNHRAWVSVGTNQAKMIWVNCDVHFDNEKDGRFQLYRLTTGVRPATNIELAVESEFTSNRHVDFWVGTGEDGLPVFGKIDNNNLDVTLRTTYTFSKNLSLQYYSQFYFSTGEYDSFRRLTAPDRLEPVDVNYDIDFEKSDFNYKSLNLNLVLRWEYLPGSTLYLVWTHARDGYETSYGNFAFSRDFKDLFDTPQTNTFLLKANYWWNI